MVSAEEGLCAKCDEEPATIRCSCGNHFCADCFEYGHLTKPKNRNHTQVLPSRRQEFANWALGKIQTIYTENIQSYFQKDEATKWFGLAVDEFAGAKVTKLVESPRFDELMESSMYYHDSSPKRQFPSMISFVGETGAGKSSLIRMLLRASSTTIPSSNMEAPVTGYRSGELAASATTGEVNLYYDPETFGTETPVFFVDCEGLSGAEPIASRYQTSWPTFGTSYLIEKRHGKRMDREMAVKDIYPKFLYIFSDVICMVTRNPKVSVELTRKVLEWGSIGAKNSINQYSLPALVIVINGPTIEDPPQSWLSDDPDAATRSFYEHVNQEIETNETLQALARENGVENMPALLARFYSSVHVCYVPCEGYGQHGTGDLIMQQVERLRRRMLSDSDRVQKTRAKNWIRYDSRLLSRAFRYAFQHLASGIDQPFDFGVLRQQATLPETTEAKITSFLNLCLSNRAEQNFAYSAEVVGSSLIRRAFKCTGSDAVRDPSIVFSETTRDTCKRAIDKFLDSSQPCVFTDKSTGARCVNTKNGHAKGHQNRYGDFLADGYFVSGEVDSDCFVNKIQHSVREALKTISDKSLDQAEATSFLARRHQELLQSTPDRKFWFAQSKDSIKSLITLFSEMVGNSALTESVDLCYGCLFGRPEYKLPCNHFFCEECIIDFQENWDTGCPHFSLHLKCMVCASPTLEGGYKIPIRPKLSGLRILSLDGGGVRGIIELVTLQRIEDAIGLNLPVGQFFDLIVGTGAGGLAALSLGQDKFRAAQSIDNFKHVWYAGLAPRMWAPLRFLFKWFLGFIYDTNTLEKAFREAYRPGMLFGMHDFHPKPLSTWPRVAVTTTVENECCLLTNYNRGDSQKYLKSAIQTHAAARATSATPLYFEPYRLDGVVCRDGGLCENNPAIIALKECRNLWGEGARIDLFLSLGTGSGRMACPEPRGITNLPKSIQTPMRDFIANVNGQTAWKRFSASIEGRIRRRARRLSPEFKWPIEPSLDAMDKLDSLMTAAQRHYYYEPYYEMPFHVAANPTTDALLETALQLRASLYYFHLDSVTRDLEEDIAVIKGSIYCRLLLPEQSSAFRKLIGMTTGFCINGNNTISMPEIADDEDLDIPVSVVRKLDTTSQPIRIDAVFDKEQHISISGFPATIEEIHAQSQVSLERQT